MDKLHRLAISEEGFIFDPETGNSYTVNETALFILNKFKEGKTEEEILDEIVENFEIDREEAAKDITDFLEQLKIVDLISKGDKNG